MFANGLFANGLPLAETETIPLTQWGVAVVVAFLVIERLFKLVNTLIEKTRLDKPKGADECEKRSGLSGTPHLEIELIATLKGVQVELKHLSDTLHEVKQELANVWEDHIKTNERLAAVSERLVALEHRAHG